MNDQKILIRLENVSAGYGNETVLERVSLEIRDREFLGIIGPNGGGKTTLMRVILGLIKPESGKITYFNDGKEQEHISLGYLPQYSQIDKAFPISCREVILSGLAGSKGLFRRFSKDDHERVREVISQMGLEGLEDVQIGHLSGGQLQRVLLGRAIVSRPAAVILDEPSTYLDRQSEGRLYELLAEINRNSAVILVSHDIGSVMQNVKAIACVNRTLHYHPEGELDGDWIEKHMGCPLEIIGHGQIPHRLLKFHHHG